MSSELGHQATPVDQARRIFAIQAVALAAAVLILTTHSGWSSFVTGALHAAGQALVIAAVIGRLWATIYIGGRKNASLVTTGPYSVTRNPLYVCSILGAVGVGLMLGSLAIAAVLGGAIAALLTTTARAEAVVLQGLFGTSYAAYAERVPLLWPRLSLYRDAGVPRCHPRAMRRALCDGLLFLLTVPAAELVTGLKREGVLPPLLALF